MDILKLGKSKYTLPKPPESLGTAVEPATLEPTRAGEVLRIDSILRAPELGVDDKQTDDTKHALRAPQFAPEESNDKKTEDFTEESAIVATTVEETKYVHVSTSIDSDPLIFGRLKGLRPWGLPTPSWPY